MATKNHNLTIDKPNQFPWKLYDMLHIAEKRNEEHIISWIKGGKAFKVHSRDLFVEMYMKKMFNQTKFKSFQRQLNLWGFERIQSGPDKGSYFHPMFVKGRKEYCQHLSRVRLKGPGDKTVPFSPNSASSTTAETVSTSEATPLPVIENASPVARIVSASTSSPVSLVGAFVDVSQPTTTLANEVSSQEDSRRQQFSEMVQHRTSEERREMIRNAAIGLSPDLSITITGKPQHKNTNDPLLYRHQEEHKDQEYSSSINQQHKQERNREHQQYRRSTSSGLEALLSVSAQRRQEENLAVLRSLSDRGVMSQHELKYP